MRIAPDEAKVTGYAQALALVLARHQRIHKDKIAFVETVSRDHLGRSLRMADVHLQWFRHVDYCWERNLRAIILAPFGHGKTSSFCVPLIAWLIGTDPNRRIKLVTNGDDTSTERVMAVKRLLESRAFRSHFRIRRGEKWTNHELYLQRVGHSVDATLQAYGVLSTGIGGRADYLFFDDVVDQKNTADVAQRNKVNRFVEQTWLSRLEPTGQALFIGTAWHAADVYHVQREKPGYCTLIQRVSQDCTCIEQEVMGVVDDQYPVLAAA